MAIRRCSWSESTKTKRLLATSVAWMYKRWWDRETERWMVKLNWYINIYQPQILEHTTDAQPPLFLIFSNDNSASSDFICQPSLCTSVPVYFLSFQVINKNTFAPAKKRKRGVAVNIVFVSKAEFLYWSAAHFSSLFTVGSWFSTLRDTAVSRCLTELGYCANLISRGNHPSGRKHRLLINKNVSWRFCKMRLVNTQVLTESTAVNRSNFQGKWGGGGGAVYGYKWI